METTKFKVESGIQLLARLTKKQDIENFYPALFKSGPKQTETIEITSNNAYISSFLLTDMISESVLPVRLNGVEAKVVIFLTDGLLNLEVIFRCIRQKILSRLQIEQANFNNNEVNDIISECIKNIYFFEIFDAMQLQATIYNLENTLIEHSNISLIIFDSLTAFYWSEQTFKITRMDTYLNNFIQLIQKVTKEFKVTLLYTRPEYFVSNKDMMENEVCEFPTIGGLSYQIQLFETSNDLSIANVTSFKTKFQKCFKITNGIITWI